ncbi:MAG: DUF2283 domain-containing protein [Anaerolineae bacterium]|nr:DUF2283 domain-containing protein [Anaerolineae bacterium]
MSIQKIKVTFDDEQDVHLAYDEECDILEVVFKGIEANCAIELTDHVLLRFNLEQGRAAGLSVLDFSMLARSTEMGPPSFSITGLDDLPGDMRRTVLKIVTTPPVNRFLKVSCFTPSPSRHIPITYVERPAALAAWA